MTRYYALVLVPGDADTPEEEAREAAAELLNPYMYDPDKHTKEHEFHYIYSPEDFADLIDDDVTQHMWRVGEFLETLAELEVEAILTPDGG
jgi:hypothetical protein